jgi:prepilin peptidase CpaA
MTDPAMLHSMALLAAATALLFAAAHDVAVRTVPNRVSLIVAAAGVGLNTLDGQLVPALFGCGVVFAGCWYCWRRGWIGGGDVKLLSACVLLVPPTLVPELMLSTTIAGGVLALCYMALARLLPGGVTPRPSGPSEHRGLVPPASLIARIWRAERRRIRRGLSLPYSCAIAAGVLLTLYVPLG